MTPPDGLYEKDFYAWTQAQAKELRAAADARVNLPLDWAQLAEEIEDLGKSERNAVRSQVRRILEHLLKLEHFPAADPRLGWEESIIEGRIAIGDALSASLRRDLEGGFTRLYADAKERAEVGLRRHGEAAALPDDCPYTLDQVLTRGWYPPSRHGLT